MEPDETVQCEQSPGLENPLPHILQGLRTSLERSGVVQQRPNGRYRLRWREYDAELGYTKHRSLALGADPDQARNVATQIERWQQEARAAQAEAKRKAMAQVRAASVAETEERLHQRLATMGVGGGRDAQRQVLREMREAMNTGPSAAIRFVLGLNHRRPVRTGRPRRLRIW